MKRFETPRSLHSPACRGSAMLMVLMALALLSITGTAAMTLSGFEHRVTGNFKHQILAFAAAEAGVELGIAHLRHNGGWRGDEPSHAPSGARGSLGPPPNDGRYSLTLTDPVDDGQGLFDPLIPVGHVRVRSSGSVGNAVQGIECLVRLQPDPGSLADSPLVAVLTLGDDSGSGPFQVNGWDNEGLPANGDPPNAMVRTHGAALPLVSQEALKTFADRSLPELRGGIPGQTGFWQDPPLNTRPWIIHVSGDMDLSGSVTVYGIIFVEGKSVTLRGSARVEGVIYAPNAVEPVLIHGGGTPWDQPVMGQVLAGRGGVKASGNHADVQLVTEYVEAFNNWAGPRVLAGIAPGTWRQL